ncbi:MAG: BlaI/MecI/CopY family transcriptional regulator [Clostridia bacterium]|nr:BlaI/MecI/CopY family transcriptional regulator [Clostridia bacterium]
MILKDVSAAELEIMKIIWAADKPVIITDIWHETQGHDWTYQTVQTFVNRLNEKGYIKIVGKQVRSYLYVPALTRAEYIVQSRGQLLDGSDGASLSDLVTLMYKRGYCDNAQLDKLRETLAGIRG